VPILKGDAVEDTRRMQCVTIVSAGAKDLRYDRASSVYPYRMFPPQPLYVMFFIAFPYIKDV